LKIYPNPAKNELSVECFEFQYNKIEIFDSSGKILVSETFPKTNSHRIIFSLNDGAYFLAITDGAIRKIKKIVVEK